MSNRLTFSLASLILIFALVVMPAMAHKPNNVHTDGTTHAENHDGWLNTNISQRDAAEDHTHSPAPDPDDPALHDPKTDPDITTVKISDDPDDASRKIRETKLTTDSSGDTLTTSTQTEGVFLVRIVFTEDVYEESDNTQTRGTDDLVSGDFSIVAYRESAPNTNIFGNTLTATITRLTDSDTTFDMVCTVSGAAYTGIFATTPDPVVVFVTLKQDVLYNDFERITGTQQLLPRGNKASATSTFRVVEAFGDKNDSTAPTVEMTPTTISIDASNQADLTITSSEMLGSTLTLSDFVFDNASGMLGDAKAVSTGGETYKLTVTVTDKSKDASVTLKKNSVMDAGGNKAPATDNVSKYTAPDATAPTVVITVESKNSDGKHIFDTNGMVRFKLTFSEALSKETSLSKLALDQDDFEITGHLTQNPLDPGQPLTAKLGSPTAAGEEESYILTVTPLSPTLYPHQEVRITLLRRSVTDLGGNILAGAHSSKFDTIPPTVKVIPPGTLTTGTDGFLLGKGEPMKTLTFTFEFSEQPVGLQTQDIDRSGGQNNVTLGALQSFKPVTGEPNTYTLEVTALDKNKQTTVLIQKETVTDAALNPLVADGLARYLPTTTEPAVKIAGPDVFRCDRTGNEVTVTFTDNTNLPSTEKLTNGEVTISKGWEIEPNTTVSNQINGGTLTAKFKVVRKDVYDRKDRTWLGETVVKVTIAKDAVKDETGQGSKGAAKDFTAGPVLTIQPNEYLVVVRDNAWNTTHLRSVRTLYLGDYNVRAENVMVNSWECMPDLGLIFDTKSPGIGGGGLIVKQSRAHDKTTIAKGTVGISEIMWSEDRGIPFGDVSNLSHAKEQWIELHNLNDFEVKVTLFELIRNEVYDYPVATDEIDRMGNYNIGARWDVPGKDGNSEYGHNFISMYRTTASTSKKYDHGDHKGTESGKWKESEYIYLTARAGLYDSGQLDIAGGDQLNYHFKGTPGRANDIPAPGPTERTPVSRSPVIFNEIANRTDSNRYYEWIELRNVTDAPVNLREYRISYLTAKDTEHELYNFPDNDNIKIAAKSVLLLVDTDPSRNEDHPVAADNPNVKYVVTDFKGMGLPDDGEFVLVLRKNNGDKLAGLKLKDHIIDVAGWDDDLVDNSKFTKVWPLEVWRNAPLSNNKLEVETVHQRRHAGKDGVYGENETDNGKTSFTDIGYSGIGYKRLISDIAAHGGTPGYDNGVAKEYNDGNATASAAPVTISEIMFDSNTRLPQWIELYNSSKTEVVKVDDWTLMLENADDVHVRTPRVSVKLAAKLIQPNQTILIVSSATGNHSDHFTDARIIDIWRNGLKDKDRLEISVTNRRAFKFLSETAFKITLKDKAGKVVDVAGNRGADGKPMWTLPMAEDADVRSSIIRRYNEGPLSPDNPTKGKVKDGTLPVRGSGDMAGDAGWILASASNLYEAHENTFYGNITDKGTPGYRGGGPVPVSLSKFRPERLESGDIVIRWVTQSELNNAGFNILRSTERNGQFTQINTSLIAGQGTTSEKTNYEWKDTTAKPNVVYYYQIQDVSLDGQVQTLRQSRLKGYLTPAGKLTTTWGDLKALQ